MMSSSLSCNLCVQVFLKLISFRMRVQVVGSTFRFIKASASTLFPCMDLMASKTMLWHCLLSCLVRPRQGRCLKVVFKLEMLPSSSSRALMSSTLPSVRVLKTPGLARIGERLRAAGEESWLHRLLARATSRGEASSRDRIITPAKGKEIYSDFT